MPYVFFVCLNRVKKFYDVEVVALCACVREFEVSLTIPYFL